jgi:hypothetical protein
VAEIDVPKSGAGTGVASEDETRRIAMWYDAVPGATGIILEEGELPRSVMVAAHEAVVRLHTVLQACVARALGGGGGGGGALATNMPLVEHAAPATAPAVVDTDATGSQVSLATALARAQAQLSPDTDPVGAVADAGGVALSAITGGSSLYGLSPEQTLMLDRAIASAASAAQLQAEAEAALEEEGEVGELSEGMGEGGGEEGQ